MCCPGARQCYSAGSVGVDGGLTGLGHTGRGGNGLLGANGGSCLTFLEFLTMKHCFWLVLNIALLFDLAISAAMSTSWSA